MSTETTETYDLQHITGMESVDTAVGVTQALVSEDETAEDVKGQINKVATLEESVESNTNNLTALSAAVNLMLPGTKKIVLGGDSHTAANFNDDGSYRQRGFLGWFNALTKCRFEIVANHGYSGYVTSYIDSQMDVILAEDTHMFWGLVGTNDFNNDNTSEELVASVDSIITKCLSKNVFPIFTLLFPREFDADIPSHAKASILNDHLRARADTGEIAIFDSLPVLREGLGNVDDDKFYDLIHLDYRGAYCLGYVMAEKMKQIAPNSTNELLSGTNNLFPNPDLTGTSGQFQNNATGVLADGLYCNSPTAGVTVTVSMGSKHDFYANNAIIIDVAVDDTVMTDNSAGITVFSIGTVLNNVPHVFAWDVEIDGTLGFSLPSASVQSFAEPTFTMSSMSEVDSGATERLPVIDDVTKLRCKTNEFTPDGTQPINTYMFIRVTDGAGRIVLENPTLIEV